MQNIFPFVGKSVAYFATSDSSNSGKSESPSRKNESNTLIKVQVGSPPMTDPGPGRPQNNKDASSDNGIIDLLTSDEDANGNNPGSAGNGNLEPVQTGIEAEKLATSVVKMSESPTSKTTPDTPNTFSPRRRRKKRSQKNSPSGLSPPSATSPNANLTKTRNNPKRKISRGLGNSGTPSVLPAQSTDKEDPFAFPNYDQQQDHQLGRKNSSKSTNENDFKSNKRPRSDDETEVMLESKSDEAEEQENSSETKDSENSTYVISSKPRTRTKEETEGKKDEGDTPEKVVPTFKLPRQLVPFNRPGVCDYGVIRTSRLRNRKKNPNTPEDILYQNIQGQRRCRATKDGVVMTGTDNTNRCLNCAEGVFKYCHSHRELDPEQKEYWEKRKQQKHDISVRSSATAKSDQTAKVKADKVTQEKASVTGSQPKAVERTVPNNTNRCIFLMKKRSYTRCSQIIHTRSCCGFHPKPTAESRPGTIICTAVSKAGNRCKHRTLDNYVFCSKHIASPPEKVIAISALTGLGTRNENIGDGNSTHGFQSMTASKKMAKKKVAKGKGSAGRTKGSVGSTTNVFSSVASRSHVGANEVPKNIVFTREIKAPTSKSVFATNFHDMCYGVYKAKQCVYKCTEGDIFCYKCRSCNDEGKPFEHIILDDAEHPDETMLQLSRCINVTGVKQCQDLAVEGGIFCCNCIRSLFLEYGESSQAGDSSDDTDSSSSSTGSDTKYGESNASQISDGSEETDFDAYCMAYTHQEFFNMWKNFERKTEKIDEVEDSRLIKKANNTMDPTDTDGQLKAQYGRVLPFAMKKMIKILELKRDDIFLDIGHGIGNTCLHATFCTGCHSRGIEVVADRHDIAVKICGGMYAEHTSGFDAETRPKIGTVDLRLGRLEDPCQKKFLTEGVTRAYVNNFNGVFAERSSKNNDKWFLDDYISAIFASMAPGAIMVTFHPLNLALDRDSANELRNRHDLEESENASYYSSERIVLGQAWSSVKWNQRSGNTNEIYVYKYKRLHQPNHRDAVFLCANPSCKLAIDMIPIPATTLNEDGRCVINHCECKFSPKNLRKRASK